MERHIYTAGTVKVAFWFMEFRKVVELLQEGKSFEEIKVLNKEQNIFGAPTVTRATQIFNTVTARIRCLPSSFYPLMLQSDVTTQKLWNLAAVLANDTLFFDFVYEVLRGKLIVGTDEFSNVDIQAFFKNKQLQDEKVAQWTDATLVRLGGSYKTMLYEAGLIDKGKNSRRIYRPILDMAMEHWLKDNGLDILVKTLTGVR
jgi:hypothetical protein